MEQSQFKTSKNIALDDTSKGAMISTIEASNFILNEPSAEETIMKDALLFNDFLTGFIKK